ncbi:hypothetical protein ASPWEDRAFT_33851 [Aspergillus wentii DTO 134E9]|uniref:Flavin reductase like domain-containing protein n=1 Tax=Aspergillus wentii DTO 134E9 TaxID=1073089 RepID=A0A1L9RZX8_ASPWE|nr:uncharacterized protein ASPWEDRAFT_33851 [Aspergillus wentii DTO 134E9]OJJ40454.1 hypothetical protein ASPWEDRAFT_33851 [Aspergillus wentii DTO 134E9]
MKLPYSRPVLVASQIAGQFRGPRFYTAISNRLSRSSLPLGRPIQQWQSCRTVADTTAASKANIAQQAQGNLSDSDIPLSDQVRLLMRRVPYPVAIITATDPHGPIDKAFRGMTVSSFNTVSLKPEPVISFNVKRPSETLNALKPSGRFLVHLLSPLQTTAALARDFSKGNHNLTLLNGEGDFEFASHAPSDDMESARPLPVLQKRAQSTGNTEAELVDFPFVLECTLKPQEIEVNDHTIVLGSVVKTLPGRPLSIDMKDNKASSASDLCLTYADTRFWEMGHKI